MTTIYNDKDKCAREEEPLLVRIRDSPDANTYTVALAQGSTDVIWLSTRQAVAMSMKILDHINNHMASKEVYSEVMNEQL